MEKINLVNHNIQNNYSFRSLNEINERIIQKIKMPILKFYIKEDRSFLVDVNSFGNAYMNIMWAKLMTV